jgi:spore coat protein U-like protein
MRTLILFLLLACLQLKAVCLVAATPVAFGTYNPLGGTLSDSSGTITVTCVVLFATTISYTITLDTGGGGSYTPRAMSSGFGLLYYNLYLDAGRNSIWGSGAGGTSSLSYSASIPLGTTINIFAVYGRIESSQAPWPGVYADSVTVTISY